MSTFLVEHEKSIEIFLDEYKNLGKFFSGFLLSEIYLSIYLFIYLFIYLLSQPCCFTYTSNN